MITMHWGLWLMFTSCVWAKEYVYDYGLENAVTTIEQRYSYWPSMHNALTLRKREASVAVPSEGGGEASLNLSGSAQTKAPLNPSTDQASIQEHPSEHPLQHPSEHPSEQPPVKGQVDTSKLNITAVNDGTTANMSTHNGTGINETVVAPTKKLDFNQPGVLMRGVIVFGGFSLLAVVYYLFYKTKGNKKDSNNTHNTHDNNQFRYGFLESDDRRDNMEFASRVPLTLESDDDEDDDLEIFDLGQKKKSLSYVNLQTNDEDIVFQKSTEEGSTGKDNILLDIEDSTSDPLINWSNSGNKSIL